MTSPSGVDPKVRECAFAQCGEAPEKLRVTCYGSSSSDTPEIYLQEARSLGYLLAKRGHTCVNGAGSFGCMAAINEGAAMGDGHIVGVIHEMWLKESDNLRDGGAHPVFGSTENAPQSPCNNTATTKDGVSLLPDGTTSSASNNPRTYYFHGGKRAMIVAGGKDLQERKRLLVENANALVVLPGGPGTWDELWEMACCRGIGLSNLPIVCISVQDYYEPFERILQRAYDDQLTKWQPHELVHFVETAEEAVRWLECVCFGKTEIAKIETTSSNQRRRRAIRNASFMHSPTVERGNVTAYDSMRRSISRLSEWSGAVDESGNFSWIFPAFAFATGTVLGAALVASRRR